MKKLLLVGVFLLFSINSFAGRSTPKGDTMAQINAVMEKVNVSTTILSVRLFDVETLHYIIEFKPFEDETCRAQGYYLELEGRDSVTSSPYYVASEDGLRRICVVEGL